MTKKHVALIVILLFAICLFLFRIDSVPLGLNNDQISQAYNALSILDSGADRYGLSYPIIFRSFGSFILPLFTYLTVFVYWLFGVSSVGINILSVIFGLSTIVVTFLILDEFDEEHKVPQSIVAIATISFVPWLLFFSRSAAEPVLGLFLFLLGVYFLMRSLNAPKSFILGCFFISLSTWAYYSERVLAFIFIPLFVVVFRKILRRYKKIVLWGALIFCLIQLPNLFLIDTGALTRRFDQVSYLSHSDFEKSGGNLKAIPFGQEVYITREFLSHFIAYFSPKSLFFLPDDQEVRSMPGLSVFYDWMIVPFIIGLAVFIKSKPTNLKKVTTLLILASLIPAALTVEPFYTTRVLLYLWSTTLIISYGVTKLPKLSIPFLIAYSLFLLYNSYFVRFKLERGSAFGSNYLQLFKYIGENRSKKFVIDNTRDVSICVRYAFSNKIDPKTYIRGLKKNYLQDYYSVDEAGENCMIDNIEVRPIDWGKDVADDIVVVGDQMAISDQQASTYNLREEIKIKDPFDKVVLVGYRQNDKK